jgi:hypothetical protein
VNLTSVSRSTARLLGVALLAAASLRAGLVVARAADGGVGADPKAAPAPADAAAGSGDSTMRSLVIADEPLPAPSMRLGEPETVVPPRLVDDVSAGAVDGMLLQEYGLEEMPRDASSGQWYSSGMRYGSAELLMMDRSRNYRRVLGFDPLVTPNPFAPAAQHHCAHAHCCAAVIGWHSSAVCHCGTVYSTSKANAATATVKRYSGTVSIRT